MILPFILRTTDGRPYGMRNLIVGARIARPLLRRPLHRHLRGAQHIFNENSVPRGGIVNENVGDGTDQLAVLNDGAAHTSVVNKGQQNLIENL